MSSEVTAFSGHQGLVVVDDRGEVGRLDAADEVRRLVHDNGVIGRYEPELGDALGDPVDWDQYAEARANFRSHQRDIASTHARFEGLAREAGTERKPPEASFAAIVSKMEALRDALEVSPHLRAEAGFVGSAAQGVAVSAYHSGLGRIGPAKRAFELIHAAFHTSPGNPHAAYGYGVAALFIDALPNWPIVRQRNRAQSATGIDIKLELCRAIDVLVQHPEDLHCQAVLELLLTAWKKNRSRHTEEFAKQSKDLPKWEREITTKNESFLEWAQSPSLRQRFPGRGAELRTKLGELRVKVRNQRSLQGIFARIDSHVDALLPATTARVAELHAADPSHGARVDAELANIRAKIAAEQE